MKPRPSPTSPKAAAERQLHDEAIDRVLRPDSRIVQPVGVSGGQLVAGLLGAIVVSAALAIGSIWAAVRYFPDAPVFRAIIPQPTVSEVRLVSPSAADSKLTSAQKFIDDVGLVSGRLIGQSVKTITDPAVLGGPTLFLSSDGLAIAFSGGVPDEQGIEMIDQADQRRLVTDRQADPVLPITYLKTAGRSTPVDIAPDDSLDVGMDVRIVLWSPVAPPILAGATIASLDHRAPSDPPGLESSERLSRRFRLDRTISSEWNGAPVFDSRGRLIGLVELAGSSDAMVVPMGRINSTIGAFQAGSFSRPSLGVRYYDLSRTANLSALTVGAQLSGQASTRTAAIQQNSAAAKAGLRNGDLVLAVNEDAVSEQDSLADLIQRHAPSSTIRLRIQRGSNEVEIPVTLGALNVPST